MKPLYVNAPCKRDKGFFHKVNLFTYLDRAEADTHSTVNIGYGIKLDPFILTNFHALGVFQEDNLQLSLQGLTKLPFKIYAERNMTVVDGHQEIELQEAVIIKSWQCKTFTDYEHAFFGNARSRFGKDFPERSCRFYLLGIKEPDFYPEDIDPTSVFNFLHARVVSLYNTFQGMPVSLEPSCDMALMNGVGNNGIVSFDFGYGSLFTVDIEMPMNQEGSPVYCSETDDCMGMVVYIDVVDHTLAVFPLCMSLKHMIVSGFCFRNECHLLKTIHDQDAGSYWDFPSLAMVKSNRKMGSGFILCGNIVITCAHVVEHRGSRVQVFNNGLAFEGIVSYRSPINFMVDLALIEVFDPCESLEASVTVSSVIPAIGEDVFAVGHVILGFWETRRPWVSAGKVVSKQQIKCCIPELPVTCSTHEGFSGGALFDSTGCIVGMVIGANDNVDEVKPYRAITVVLLLKEISRYLEKFLNSKKRESDVIKLDRELLIHYYGKSFNRF